MEPTSKPLGKFRKRFFPIYNHELPQISPLFILFFLVTMNYGILRSMKDALIQATGGAVLIARVKFFAVIPSAVLFKFMYDTLSRKTGSNGRVYGVLLYFIGFFLLYWFVLHHFTSSENPTKEMPVWEAFSMVWPSVLFYINAEMYGSLVLSVVTWAFVNEITPRKLGERCYSTFSISTGVATFIAGYLSSYLSAPASQPVLITIIITGNVLYILVYFYFTRNIALHPEQYTIAPKKGKKKKKLGFIDSVKYLFTSENAGYIFLILCLVVSYGIGVNLFEAVYKEWLNHVADLKYHINSEGFASSKEYRKAFSMQMSGLQLQLIGITSLVTTLFLASFVNNKGWRIAALFVPVSFFILVVAFFSAITLMDRNDVQSASGVLYLGVTVVVCVKSFKYVFFDRTKELLYKGFSTPEEQAYSKSAVDGVGSRFGKAGGAFIVQFLTTWVCGFDVLDITGIFFLLVMVTVSLWIFAVLSAEKKYQKMKDIADGDSKKAADKPKATTENVRQGVKSQ